ncbi:hypothetical protein GQ53DRAFT_141807 [Thozetella sp. PMI_491]|nr:hypothetical protein GQ53DRAFT_141807 [Thozetella sp. PMI_491]
MKTTTLLMAATAGISGVAAQNYPSNMPQCGHVCGDNLLAMFGSFNCSSKSDYACLCRNMNFGYGVHDCAVEACQDNNNANIVIGWGNQLCKDAGVTVDIPTASLTTSGFTSTFTSGGSTITTTGQTTIFTGTRSPVSTSTFTTTFTSGGTTFTSTEASTIFSTGTHTGTTTSGSGSGSGSRSSTTSTSTSTSTGGAAQTAAPVVGLLAAAGLAAALL